MSIVILPYLNSCFYYSSLSLSLQCFVFFHSFSFEFYINISIFGPSTRQILAHLKPTSSHLRFDIAKCNYKFYANRFVSYTSRVWNTLLLSTYIWYIKIWMQYQKVTFLFSNRVLLFLSLRNNVYFQFSHNISNPATLSLWW